MTIKERIQQYIDHKGISVYRLEAAADLSKGYWAKTKSISADVAMKISRVYPDISADWLLRGEGEMLKPQQNSNGMNNSFDGTFFGGKFAGRDIIDSSNNSGNVADGSYNDTNRTPKGNDKRLLDKIESLKSKIESMTTVIENNNLIIKEKERIIEEKERLIQLLLDRK